MLAAQVRTEITCVFDGADLGGRVPVPAARGVRVLFSPAGVTADELLDELVQAEPAGRRIVVVSSDREVAAAARREGAEPLDSALLVDRLVQQRRT
jgi:predicted RNA-binding protein with PIN domain